MMNRRTFLAAAAAGSMSAASKPLIIDTHLEVWTFDPKFPFHHPERSDLKRVPVEAPIENEVSEMDEFGLKYASLRTAFSIPLGLIQPAACATG
jgi:hypothetical protein